MVANLTLAHMADALGRVLAMGDVAICKERPGAEQYASLGGGKMTSA
jgi:hypothetical protein